MEKVFDRIDWEAMWYVLRMYEVGGKLPSGVKSFYKDKKSCVKVNGKMGESFRIHGVVRLEMFDVTVAVKFIYGFSYERDENNGW